MTLLSETQYKVSIVVEGLSAFAFSKSGPFLQKGFYLVICQILHWLQEPVYVNHTTKFNKSIATRNMSARAEMS